MDQSYISPSLVWNIYWDAISKKQKKNNKNLDKRHEILKLLQEYIEKTLKSIGTGKEFLSRSPIAQEIIESINLKFLYSKRINRVKREPTEWETFFY